MLNTDKPKETNLPLWKYFTDDGVNVRIRIFRMGGLTELLFK
jgi:hypothetical protein